jgi:hypothetical protein
LIAEPDIKNPSEEAKQIGLVLRENGWRRLLQCLSRIIFGRVA